MGGRSIGRFWIRGSRCHYCGQAATTRDHIVPKSKGGGDGHWNLVPACKKCNQAKADTDPTCQCRKCRNAVSIAIARCR